MTKKILASSFYEFNFVFFLITLYIILDIHQPPNLSSVEKIDHQEDGTICFFPLKAESIDVDLEIRT